MRGSYASLLLVHRSMEEAAASVGATGLAHLPRRHAAADLARRAGGRALLVHDLAAGGLRGAVPRRSAAGRRSPIGIFAFYIAGSANEAAALGVILIVVAAISVAIINRMAGTRMGGMFG